MRVTDVKFTGCPKTRVDRRIIRWVEPFTRASLPRKHRKGNYDSQKGSLNPIMEDRGWRMLHLMQSEDTIDD